MKRSDGFEKLFGKLVTRVAEFTATQDFSGKWVPFTVFQDFVTMSGIAIANSAGFDQDRENQYLAIAKKYSKEELTLHADMLAELAIAYLDDIGQDFLGEFYMKHGFGNRSLGQIFTPFHIAELMAEMTGNDLGDKGWISVYDPTCGSGVMLLAKAHSMQKAGIDYSEKALFVGQDLDPLAAYMCCVQMCMAGMAGYVVVGNSLVKPLTGHPLFPPKDALVTPVMARPVWVERQRNALVEAGYPNEETV